MYDNGHYFLSMFDGICDQTRELKTLNIKMPNTTLSGGKIALHYTRDEWLISLESLKILLLKSFKPFQLKFKFFYQIYMNQNA